jgi:hypothetical protein
MLMISFEAKGEERGAKKAGCSPQEFFLRAFLLVDAKGVKMRIIVITDTSYRA